MFTQNHVGRDLNLKPYNFDMINQTDIYCADYFSTLPFLKLRYWIFMKIFMVFVWCRKRISSLKIVFLSVGICDKRVLWEGF